MEVPPKSASVVCDLETYRWNDFDWMQSRAHKDYLKEPMSIYEMHLGSSMLVP